MNVNTTIKCEPSWEEEGDEEETVPLENVELPSGVTYLKEETKSELTEPELTQESTFEPSAAIKDEIFIKEHTVDQLFPCSTETSNDVAAAVLARGLVHSCNICCKTFKRSRNLQRHLLIHTGERPFSCTTCGNMFADQSHLKTHMLIHSETKTFKCMLCGGAFRKASNLKHHKITHSEKRPFSCPTCGNTFKRSHDLRKHEKNHAHKKSSPSNVQFDCSICGNIFKWASNYKEHKLLHTECSPFSCSTCGKTFKRICSLRLHEKRHSDSKTFCGK